MEIRLSSLSPVGLSPFYTAYKNMYKNNILYICVCVILYILYNFLKLELIFYLKK